MSQLVRFCDINMNVKNFIKDVKTMTEKFLNQGFVCNTLKQTFMKFCEKYYHRWAKFGVDILGLTKCIY